MTYDALPPFAAWRHNAAREGFEVVFFRPESDGVRLRGRTTAVEDGAAFTVSYDIALDAAWRTRSARIDGETADGPLTLSVTADGAGHWWIDGQYRSDLDGCLDLDLASSTLTNAFPVHRLGLTVGDVAESPAVYVRELDLSVTRLDQQYRRVADADGQRYDYTSPAFDVRCVLHFDRSGLVRDYPGIAVRSA